MFERFPTFKRLERLLSRASAFSPKKAKRAPRRDLADSPIQAHSRRLKKTFNSKKNAKQKTTKKVPRVDTVESFSDVSQRPPPGKRIPISRVQHLFDSDTVLNRQRAVNRPVNKLKPINVCQENKESVSQKRVRTTSLRSPREVLRSRGRTMLQMEKLDPSPLNDRGIHVPLVKTIGKKVFLRKMQEPTPSDALNVLSEEENEEPSDSEEKKTVRYPLPTMPLSIMVPVNDIPDYVSPMDLETVRKKVSRFDINIATLMESRKKLASSYSLFDELCASFRGPENLDRFLQSLMTNRPMTALSSKNLASKNKFPENLQAAIQKTDNQQVKTPQSGISKGSVGEDSSGAETNGSRLYRPTVSTTMKRVERVEGGRNGPKYVLAHEVSTDINIQTRYRPSASIRHPWNGRRTKKHSNKNITRAPVSEEDARADMLHRVRRGLINLPWASKARRRSSASRCSVRLSNESQ